MRHPRAWQTQATSPGGTREASPRHKDRGLGPTGRERESGNAAWRVEKTRAHASCAPGTRRSGPARQIGPSGEIRTTRLLGAPLPSIARGRKETGKPQARPKLGPIKLGRLTTDYDAMRAVCADWLSHGITLSCAAARWRV